MRYFGPFKIVQRIGLVAYKLELPLNAKIHSVFYISVLKKCEGNPPLALLPSPLLWNERGYKLQPHVVLGHRMVKINNK